MTWLLALFLLQAPADPIDALTGTWRLIPEATDPIKPAIDKAVAKMNFLIRGLARNRLQARNAAPPAIDIRREPNQLRIRLEGYMADRMHPLNGETWHRKVEDGEVDIQLKPMEDGFLTSYTNKDGGRENRFRLKSGELHMSVTITSPYLTEPVRYTLRYQRR